MQQAAALALRQRCSESWQRHWRVRCAIYTAFTGFRCIASKLLAVLGPWGLAWSCQRHLTTRELHSGAERVHRHIL